MLVVFTFGGLILRVNPAWERTLGWSPGDLVGRPNRDLIHEADWEGTARHYGLAIASGAPATFENRYRCSDGSYRWLEWTATPSANDGLLYASARDITERRQAESSLRESEQRYHRLLEQSPLAKLVYDVDTFRILEANAAALRLYGYTRTQMFGMTAKDVHQPEDRPSFLASIHDEGPIINGHADVWHHRRCDGTTIEVEVSAHSIVYEGRKARLAAIIDVTERRRLELQFRQAQKMEAVGRLAGGVAHDFNNLLAVILSCTEFLLTDLAEDDARRTDVIDIRQAGQRAASLTRQLLAFSRKQVLKPEVLSLNDLVGDIAKLLKRLIGEDIRLVTTLHPELGRVMVDRGQMEQVLLNLAINSRDAMPQGGSLLIQTANIDVEASMAFRLGDVPEGRFAVLTVKDTGSGMDRTTLTQIFEPFFTTKEPGKGTGLGLATVFGIVKQSGGAITVDSTPGRGTSISVYLPRIDGSADATGPRSTRFRASKGSETILLVEDDDLVRGVVRRMLRTRGYEVIEANDAGTAFARYEANPDAIDLVITDLVIPGFDGLTIASELSTRTPRVKVLYMSGYTEHAVLGRGTLEPGVNFIQKPFSADELALIVRKVLDA